jgi:hypothetical protein
VKLGYNKLGYNKLRYNKLQVRRYKFNVAAELRGFLSQNGLKNWDLGKTYIADRLRKDGSLIESAIDHIYTN